MAHAYIKPIADALLTGFGTDLFAKSTQFIEGIAPLFMSGFCIYVMLVLMDSYKNGLEENFLHLAKKFLGWIIVIALAFNATEYLKLANILYNLPDQMSSFFDHSGIDASALDTAFNNVIGMTDKILAYGAKIPITRLDDKITISILSNVLFDLGLFFFLIVFAMYLIAKISLAMIILTGPLFIGFLLFPATRQWGMNWIGQVLNYSVSVVLYVALSTMQMDYFHHYLEHLLGTEITSIEMIFPIMANFLVSTVIFSIVALSIPSIASALTGGASISGHMHTLMRLAKLKMGGGKGGGGGSMKKD